MKDIMKLFVLALIPLLFALGCTRSPRTATDVQLLVRDYDATWDAVFAVMSRHFLIAEASRSNGIVQAAPVRNDGRMGQAETRVSARIFPARSGGYDVEIRAVNYLEISEPYNLSSRTPRYDWVMVGFDQKLQAELLNEIDTVRYEGRSAARQNAFLQSPEEPVITPAELRLQD
ncbi:MAG: hypothetical protein E4H28_07850 [Gemmatimonadales bacterium]|nr:MAG: hypothetical protein E4H28_07850 [Gemmatimonadales bacterium]